MLSDEIIEKLEERLVQRITNANLFVIKKIAKKIKEMGTIQLSNSFDVMNMLNYGGDLDKITEEIAKETELNVKDIYKIFEEVAKDDQNFAKQFYKYKNKKFIPWKDNEFLRREVDTLAELTANNYVNIAKTSGIGYTVKDNEGNTIFKDISTLYKDMVDDGLVSLSQGKTSFDEEMGRLMKQIAMSGLKYVEYESGHTRRLDSALRMNLNDGLKKLHNKSQEIFGREFGADGVEVSVHNNPAPDHEQVQGRQFSTVRPSENELSEWEKFENDQDCKSYDGIEFPAVSEETGRDRRSISEYNCKHHTFAIVLGVSKPQYTNEQLQAIIDKNEEGFEFEGKKYTMYEGTQLQRKIETQIRKNMDLQIMGKESGRDDLVQDAQRNIDQLTNKYYELSQVSGLSTKLERMQVPGYIPVKIKETQKTPPTTKIKNENKEVVFISKEENERLANIWLDYYSEETSRSFGGLRTFEQERYERLLEQKKKGFKDEKINLDSIEDCNKLLDKVNTKITTEKGDIQNTDFRLIQEATQSLYENTKKSPAILEDLRMNKAFLRAEKNTAGVANTQMNTITLNNSYYGDYNSFYKMCQDNTELHLYLSGEHHSWWSEVAKGNETKEIITHEFGHRLQNAVAFKVRLRNIEGSKLFDYFYKKYGSENSFGKYIDADVNKIERDLIYEPIRRLQEKEGLTQKEIINKYVSMYGRESYKEMFAEVFANSQLGKSNALGDELIKFLIEIGEWEK